MGLVTVRNISLASLLLSSIVLADDDVNGVQVTDVSEKYEYSAETAKVGELVQKINLGFANTTGNTDTLNFNGKYTLDYAQEGYNALPMHVGFHVSAFRTEDEEKTTNEEYSAKLYLDQELSSDWLVYGFADWLRNAFRNFENKWTVGTGIGKILLDDGQQTLRAKIGVAYNRESYSNAQETETFSSLTQYLEYQNRLNETSKFYLHAGASENFDDFSNDYELTGVIGLDFIVSEDLHVILEEEVTYDALPPVGFKKTDTKSIVRLGYGF